MGSAADTDREFSLEDLHAVVAQIWSAYLEVDGHGGLTVVTDSSARIPVTASVPMNGAFTGHVAVATTATSARRVASLMLEIEPTSVHEDDVIDAVGELANIIAGNVKALLPQPTISGIPSVTLESETRFLGEPTQQLWGKWGRDTFYVGVLNTSRR